MHNGCLSPYLVNSLSCGHLVQSQEGKVSCGSSRIYQKLHFLGMWDRLNTLLYFVSLCIAGGKAFHQLSLPEFQGANWLCGETFLVGILPWDFFLSHFSARL